MKKAILYRCKSTDGKGNYNPDGLKEVVRNSVSVTQEYIDEQNAQTWQSGLYYEVDEKATAELEKRNRVLAGLEEETTEEKQKRGRKAANTEEEV